MAESRGLVAISDDDEEKVVHIKFFKFNLDSELSCIKY